ncbi:MAG: sodium:solute symporter family transporter [Parvularculaceae bacterium]
MEQLPAGQLTIFLALYVLVQVAIGIWAGRGAKSTTDYYLGGRRVGFLPLMMSIFATWFGAETILGSAAAINEGGLSGARAEPFGYALCLTLMAIFVAGPIRRSNYVTISDFFRERFGKAAEFYSAVISVIISVIWAGAQLLAIAAILETVVGIPGLVTLLAAAAIVILYCYFAGLNGDIATDVVQGIFLITGVVILFMAVAAEAGGLTALLGAIKPEQLRLVAPGETLFARIDNWMIPVIGSLVTQEVITRFLAARSTSVARAACFSAGALYLALGMLPVLIGLAGPTLAIPGAEGDNFIPAVALTLLPQAMAIVLVGALFSAILSTVDSNLLAVSSLVSINILRKGRARRTDAEQLGVARLTTVAAGLGALAVALSGSNIYELLAMTSIFGQGGIMVATMIGLRSSFGGPGAALAAIFGCVVFNLATLLVMPMAEAMGAGMSASEALAAILAGDVAPIDGFFLWSIAVSLAAYIGVAALTPRAAPFEAPR